VNFSDPFGLCPPCGDDMAEVFRQLSNISRQFLRTQLKGTVSKPTSGGVTGEVSVGVRLDGVIEVCTDARAANPGTNSTLRLEVQAEINPAPSETTAVMTARMNIPAGAPGRSATVSQTSVRDENGEWHTTTGSVGVSQSSGRGAAASLPTISTPVPGARQCGRSP
jgi:hypothetical protein